MTRSRPGRASVHLMLGAAVASPVFLHADGPLSIAGTTASRMTYQTFGIHWSVVLLPLFLSILGRQGLHEFTQALPRPARRAGVLLIVWLATVAIVAAIVTGDISSIFVSAQLILPSGYLVVGLGLSATGRHRTLKTVAWTVALSGVAILGSNLAAVLVGDAQSVAARFPQFLTYYPGVLALGIAALVGGRSRKGLWVFYFATLFLLSPALWSRLGIATLLFTVVVAFLSTGATPGLRSLSGRPASRFRRIAVAALATAMGMALVASALSGAIGTRLESKSSVLESGRMELMSGAIERIVDSPVYGDAARPLFDRSLLGGARNQGARLYPAHNQLLDIGIRGGLPAIMLALVLIASLAVHLWRSRALSRQVAAGVCGLSTMVFASMSDLYFSQALTAALGWLLIGCALRSASDVRSARSEPEPALDVNRAAQSRLGTGSAMTARR